MATVTQTIPNYHAGISEQPDQIKFPGQVKNIVNAIPDVTYGLYKRPGTKRLGTDRIAGDIPAGGSWFHYYRDETEGSYIGQVASDGKIRIWSCNDGSEKNVWYHTDNSAYNGSNSDHTSITSYLTPSPSTDTEDIQALTINDTTFLNNRSKIVGTTGTTDARPHTHFAFIEIIRTENGRQYALNLHDPTSNATVNVTRATRVKINGDNLDEGAGTGHCPGIGTQVFSGAETNTGSKKNLTFRITALGQQGKHTGNTDNDTASIDYACSYNREVTLLHGGEDWAVNDTTVVTLDSAQTSYNYTIKVTEAETVAVSASIAAIRPAPTPFDADTAVTVDTVIGGIMGQISNIAGSPITATQIGTGIYLTSNNAFNVEVMDNDLMRVMQGTVNDVTKLPIQCKHGYIVKISNTRMSDEDDYYTRFYGPNDKDGSGVWIECPEPGIIKSLDATTMPHILQRQADGDFLVKKYTWKDRTVGDNVTNPLPSFVGQSINKVVFFRNRLVFLSGENVITSRPGSIAEPNFFNNSALTIGATDPVDISCASLYPSELFDAVEINTGLLCFSTNQQFLLSADDTVFNPDTAKLRTIANHNYNKVIPPLKTTMTVGFVDNSYKYSRFMELIDIKREGEPQLIETSKLCPTLLEKDIDNITQSIENNMIFFGKTDSDTIVGFRYLRLEAAKTSQQAWFKWKFNNPLRYHFAIEDTYYFLDTDGFLHQMNLIQDDTDPSITQDGANFLLHLDNYSTIRGGVYDSTTSKTTFTHNTDSCIFNWQNNVSTPNGKLVIADVDTATARVGRYAECTVTSAGATFTVPGNWDYTTEHVIAYSAINTSTEVITISDHGWSTGDEVRWVEGDTTATGLVDGTTYFVIKTGASTIKLATSSSNATAGTAINITAQGTGNHKLRLKSTTLYIGYLYDYEVEFPRIYIKQRQGERVTADINSKLTVHRIKISFGKIGLYETTLTRVGKDPYTEIYESTDLDEYQVSDAPYLEEKIKDIPVYEQNRNVDIKLKSSHPSPAILRSMSWEGDYSPMNYQRL